MSEPKFTKGEWVFNGYDGSITDNSTAKNDIAFVALADWDKLNTGYHNAHLIACAPEMYAMLKMLLDGDSINDFTIDIEVAKLLAKARGEHE